MQQIELSKHQQGTKQVFEDNEAVKKVKEYRWNVGNAGEDPIINTARPTASVITEILHTYLDEYNKAILPQGMVDKENVIRTNFKNRVLSEAAEKLEDEVLLPDGSTVSADKVEIKEENGS